MTLKTIIAADAAIFFNVDECGEPATYNGSPITVIPKIGATLQPGDLVNNDGTTSRAVFILNVSEVPAPVSNDKIVHNGITWTMVKKGPSDSVMHQLECVSSISPHRLR